MVLSQVCIKPAILGRKIERNVCMAREFYLKMLYKKYREANKRGGSRRSDRNFRAQTERQRKTKENVD